MPAKKTAKKVAGKAPEEPKMVEVEVTAEILEKAPELKADGVSMGDLIEVTAEEAKKFGVTAEVKEEKPVESEKGAMAILKGEEYVRTFGPDQKEAMKEFLSKNPNCVAVPDKDVKELEVPYEVKEKGGAIKHTAKRFTDKADAVKFKNEHRSVCVLVKK